MAINAIVFPFRNLLQPKPPAWSGLAWPAWHWYNNNQHVVSYPPLANANRNVFSTFNTLDIAKLLR